MGKALRNWALVLGAGLTLLWLASLGNTRVDWLSWLELAAALAAFAVAGTLSSVTRRETRSGACIALAIGLFVLWYVALSAQAEPWIVWWNFGIGCLSLLLGIAAASSLRTGSENAAPVEGSIRHPVGAAYPYEWGPGVGPNQRPEDALPTIENPQSPKDTGAAA